MKKRRGLKRPLISFVLLSFIIFVILLALIGIVMGLGAPNGVIDALKNVAAWSSTFAFIILFKKIYPEMKFIDFVKKQFSEKLNLFVLGLVIVIPIVIFISTLVFIPSYNTGGILIYTSLPMLMYWFFYILSSGAMGEELGWRGYFLNELLKKNSLIKSSLIMGLLCGLWHLPLWMLSGYTGIALLQYCIIFMITIIAYSVIITFFYSKNRNLIIAIVFHQAFNFLTSLINADILDVLFYTSIGYVIVAVLIFALNYKKMVRVNIIEN